MEFLYLTLTICPNRSSFLVGPLDSIQCPLRADVCKFLLLSLHWRVCVLESIRERRLNVLPFISQHVLSA